MWISRKNYEITLLESAKRHEEARVLSDQNRALQTSMDWFRFRLTQLEHERHLLVKHYMGINLPVPQIEADQKAQPAAQEIAKKSLEEIIQGGGNMFADIGDKAAREQGIEWNEDGTVKR